MHEESLHVVVDLKSAPTAGIGSRIHAAMLAVAAVHVRPTRMSINKEKRGVLTYKSFCWSMVIPHFLVCSVYSVTVAYD